MRYIDTPEMKRLKEIFVPYIDKNELSGFKKGTPQEIIDAEKKYGELFCERDAFAHTLM